LCVHQRVVLGVADRRVVEHVVAIVVIVDLLPQLLDAFQRFLSLHRHRSSFTWKGSGNPTAYGGALHLQATGCDI